MELSSVVSAALTGTGMRMWEDNWLKAHDQVMVVYMKRQA